MFINVESTNHGHKFAVRAGRFFPTGEVVRLEVVKTESDPTGPDGKPLAEKIGRRTFELLKADKRLRIMSDEETSSRGSDAAVQAAKADAVKALEDAVEARAEAARLRDRVKELEQDLAKATKRVAELEKAAAKADQKPAS